MDWQQGLNIHSASAGTSFVKFRIFWDTKNTAGIDDVRYEARIETIIGAGLRQRDDIGSIEEAKSWCEQEYKALLTAELATI